MGIQRLGSHRVANILSLEPGQTFAGLSVVQVELGHKWTYLSGQCATHWVLER